MERLDIRHIGPILQAARMKENLTQEALAEQVGITNRYVSSIENEGKCPSLGIWIRIIPLIRMILMLSERDRKIITATVQTMLNEQI